MMPQEFQRPPENAASERDRLRPDPVAAPRHGHALGAVILCRMESSRLPGKALADLDGRPLLVHVIARCRRAACLAGRVVVATTERPADDALADLAAREGLPVFRGSSDNVAARLLRAAREHGFDAFFRVNGDSPLLDPALLDQAASLLHPSGADLVTNLCPRSFPYGISVELVRTDTYARAFPRFHQPAHFEHATSYLYRPGSDCRIVNIHRPGPDLSRARLTVDTPADLAFLRRFLAHARNHGLPADYETAAAFCRSHEAN